MKAWRRFAITLSGFGAAILNSQPNDGRSAADPSPAVMSSLTTGLAGFWRFNGDGKDASGSGRDLTITGNPSFVSGKFGQAMSFDGTGNQFASRPGDDTAFDLGSGDFTVQIWANFKTEPREQTLIEKFTGASGPGWSFTTPGGQSLEFYSTYNQLQYVLPISTGAWYHFLARNSSGNLTLFVNGTAVAGLQLHSIPPSVNPLLIGRRNSGDARNFAMNGLLEDAAIWTRALSDAEILAVYQGGLETALSTTPVTVLDKLTSASSGIVNNACAPPPPESSFPTTTAAAYLYFDVNGAAVGDVATAKFYRPDGVLYQTDSWKPLSTVGTGGYSCFSDPLAISGTAAAGYPGAWSAGVFWDNSPTPLFTLSFTIAAPAAPVPAVSSVANSAPQSSGSTVAPGSIVSIYGTNLSTVAAGVGAPGFPLPATLGQTQVLMNGIAAPLLYVSASQINAVVPWELSGATVLSLQVKSGGSISPTATTGMGPVAPGIYVIVHATDSSPLSAANPAQPGEYLVIYATGLGPVTNQPPTGIAAPTNPLARTIQSATVTINGIQANVPFAGLTPDLDGLYQVDVQVPNAVKTVTASCWWLTLLVGGVSAPAQCIPNGPPPNLTFVAPALPDAIISNPVTRYACGVSNPSTVPCDPHAPAQNPMGGVPPYNFQLETGTFPPIGIILAPDGTLSGAPVGKPGVYPFGICAVDSAANQVCVNVSITVSLQQQTVFVLNSLVLSPGLVIGPNPATGTVTVAAPPQPLKAAIASPLRAPAAGLTVSLQSSSGAAQVPPSVTIPPGATSANFTVTTSAVTTPVTAAISATLSGVTKTASLTIDPPQVQNYTLTVIASPAAGGTASPSPPIAGTSCGSGCWSYPPGAQVTLAESANPGWSFAGWSGGGCYGTGGCTVTMNSNLSVTANFSSGGSNNSYAYAGNYDFKTIETNPASGGCQSYTSQADEQHPIQVTSNAPVTASGPFSWTFTLGTGMVSGTTPAYTCTSGGTTVTIPAASYQDQAPGGSGIVSGTSDGHNLTFSAASKDFFCSGFSDCQITLASIAMVGSSFEMTVSASGVLNTELTGAIQAQLSYTVIVTQ